MKRRVSKRKTPITDAERAWLVGDEKNCGFTSFPKPGDKDGDYQANLWRDHGDSTRFSWVPGQWIPERRRAKIVQQDQDAGEPETEGLARFMKGTA